MADRTAAYLRDIDAPRALPARMRERLEGALVASTLEPADENLLYILDRPKRMPADMRLRLTEMLTGQERDEAFAAHFEGLDDPRPLPAAMRARLINRLMARGNGSRIWQISGAAAAAVLVMVATVWFTVNRDADSPSPPGRAISPIPTVTTTVPPPATIPPTSGGTPTVRPPSRPTVRPTTRVLGVRETRRPQPVGPGSQPSAQPTSGLPLTGRTAARTSAPAAATPTDLVGSLVELVRSVLGALNLDVLSAGRPTEAVVPAAPAAAPTPAAPKTATTRRGSAAKPAASTPKATAPKASKPAQPKPLLELPLLADEPVITVEVPVVELTISL